MKHLYCLSFLAIAFSLSAQDQELFTPAVYHTGNLKAELRTKVKYPFDAVRKAIDGDVIFKGLISVEGSLDSLRVVSSPSPILTKSVLTALQSLTGSWTPTLVNEILKEKDYLFVFRFRRFQSSPPPDYLSRADKLYQKGKYEKARKQNDAGMEVNHFSSSLWNQRAKILQALNDPDSVAAEERADHLAQEVILNLDVYAIGKMVQIRTSNSTGLRENNSF